MGIFNIFNNKNILCPYCLTETKYSGEIKNCGNTKCNAPYPILYYRNSKIFPPFFLQMTGWSQVGKSAYLWALTKTLQKMNGSWNGFTIAPETDKTMLYMQNLVTIDRTGNLPRATQLLLQEAYIMEMGNMPRWGNRTMVTRDVAGEAFQGTLNFSVEYMPYFLHVPTTLMLISPTDMEFSQLDPNRTVSPSMNFLMDGFINTLAGNNHDFARDQRRVVVVITKADRLQREDAGTLKLPVELDKYLSNDPFSGQRRCPEANGQYMENYMARLAEIGKQAKQYVWDCVAGGSLFISRAKSYNISLDFCLVSSLGSNPGVDNIMNYQPNPMRVLDPLLLAMDHQSY